MSGEECMACKSSPAVMWSVPCGCYGVCKKCAMKMATGGRCKACRQFFAGFSSKPVGGGGDGDGDDDGGSSSSSSSEGAGGAEGDVAAGTTGGGAS